MSAETTPAIERAGEAIFGHDDSGEDSLEDVRRGLAAALDVEEMAQAMASRAGGSQYLLPMYRELAEAVRTAILGIDS